MEIQNNNIPSFNLWTEPWIGLESGKKVTRHNIRDALLNAQNYSAIYDPSPLVIVGLHRLLTAILQDALNPQENSDLERLWKDGRFPVDKIEEFEKKYSDRFDLFSEDKPFLQSADLPLIPKTKDDVKDETSVARLFPEIPSGTLVTHYHHIQGELIFSPTTAALGLVALPPFMSSGGPGLMPSINGIPPVYILPGGKTLFESLTGSLISRVILDDEYGTAETDEAWWKRPTPLIVKESKKRDGQLTHIGYLHGLTFPARKVRLHPERLNAICSRSGQISEWCIKTVSFSMGESIDEALFWRDPFVAYKLPVKEQNLNRKPKSKKVEKKQKPNAIRPMQNRGKATWREFSGLFLQQNDNQTLRPRFLDQFSLLSVNSEFEKYPFRCIAFQTDGKMKFFEWFDFGFDVPIPLLRDPDGAYWTDEALSFSMDCSVTIKNIFSKSFGRKIKTLERFRRLKERLETGYWSNLAGEFRLFILGLGEPLNRTQMLEEWFNKVVREAQNSFDAVADSTGDTGSTLHNIVQGKALCKKQLNILRDKTKKGGRNDRT